MEIKVGQWIRYKKHLNHRHKIKINRIAEIDRNGDWYYTNDFDMIEDNDIIKTADNIEDLLEIFDIVHWYNKFSNKNIETIIKSFSDIYFIKNHVNNLGGKITAIELHENRQVQQIGEQNG